MKRWTPFFAVIALLSGAALAATNITVEEVFQVLFRPWTRTTTQLPSATAYTGYVAYNTTASALTVSDGVTWRTASPLLGTASWDFPALEVVDALGTVCSETAAIPIAGAAIGDSCDVSSNLGADGGAGLAILADITCRVSAAGVGKAKLCLRSSTDGGTSYNLHDAGFYLRASH